MKKLQNNHIPETGHTYTEYRFITETCILIYKRLGFTPLQVLKEIKQYLDNESASKITFAGRLDPMAEGYIHLLWSGDMKEKEVLMNLDKEYQIEVVLGVNTDTDDVLGLIENYKKVEEFEKNILNKFIGPFEYDYPKYSSPNIKKVLDGDNFENKKQNGYIYNIELLSIENKNIKEKIFDKLNSCEMDGDFRVDEIKNSWSKFFNLHEDNFLILNLKVKCKSGTYMRVLARELGGFAMSIVRSKEF